jgi:hypothetical protein
MYAGAKTWNPFRGCEFRCTYCVPSFQAQAKRQAHRCTKCAEFTPHCHPERLFKIPNSEIVFVCGVGDISFCPPKFTWEIVRAVMWHSLTHPNTTYYLQSKRPEYFEQFIPGLPNCIILGTTLETNRTQGYREVSLAPLPRERYRQFTALDHPRKYITIEPVMNFETDWFVQMLIETDPEHVWIGRNSRPKSVQLPEPSPEKVAELINRLRAVGIEVRTKDLRETEN